MPITTETVIVAALKSGNLRRAVELLLDSYQEELFSYCARLAGPEEASSVYQRVLSLALENVHTVEGTASVRAWLFRIARTIMLQLHRASARGVSHVLADDYVPVCAPRLPGAEASAAPAEERLGRLEGPMLEVLQLSLWHGLLLFEVAHVMDRSEVEVRRLASQGLNILALETPDRSVAPS